MPEVVLRNGSPADGLAIVNEYWRNQATDNHVDSVRRALASLPSKVAEMDGTMVGFVYCGRFAPDILEIYNIFVNEAFRNQRIGSRLLQSVEHEAREQYSGIILSNSDLYRNPVLDKKDASSLYLRHGYELIFKTAGSRVFAKQL